MSRREKLLRGAGVVACQMFAIITLIRIIPDQPKEGLILAAVTPVLILAPEIVERLFQCRINTPVYLFCLFYAIGPMLGVCYNLYYRISWWDKMLHVFGGLTFAVFGLHVFETFAGENKNKRLLTALFGACFSIAVSVIWEFAEFGADQFLGMDMQSDWVIHSIRSYSIGETMGMTGVIEHINSVVVNGETLPISGYLDIGLVDTMLDMLLESLGAVAVAGLYLIDKGRHPVLIPRRNRNSSPDWEGSGE